MNIPGLEATGLMEAIDDRPRRILVITVVHDPRDSRIWFRQIDALLRRGWQVSYAAPLSDERPLTTDHLGPEERQRLRLIRLPRARGRNRLRAALSARSLVRREQGRHDVVLIHDPELLAATWGLQIPHLVWDVHEDTAGALAQKSWLPNVLREPVARAVRQAERWAEERFTLLLAETDYQQRFRKAHTVVPNAVVVPGDVLAPASEDRVVYLGSISEARGSHQLPQIGRMLRERTGGSVKLEVIGPTYDEQSTELMRSAHADNDLIWRGFLPADQALARLHGALAGLSLLQDTPNFRSSMPTKVVEYCAYGVPVITTPLPRAAQLVERGRAGLVVGWDSPHEVAAAVLELAAAKREAAEMGRRGHRLATAEYDWSRLSQRFLSELESVVGRSTARVERAQPSHA
ncbi:glycosyltransferase [Microlunatus soli]|uniref:Glycosyltransferase involved in cell wall bisynthesis n=1 Tax=Microlunatus soli TaxID=630515 RepID=A0A1H2ANB0_9ACTN|nr:glycosyltransferase [Microlunatus soli]SDT47423.1 Glycosyltransferase involved in cell wall bisynthesis [Microlunatus soli]